MTKDDCFQLGEIVRLHGLKGEVIAFIDADHPRRYEKMDSVFLENAGRLVPFMITNIKVRDNAEAIITFEDVDHEEAEMLIGSALFLPLDMLPPLRGNKFYYHEVPGFRVIDKQKGEIGTITRVLDMPRQAVLQVDSNGKEVLIPVADSIILDVDRENKQVHVDLPEGLLDIYLG